MRRFVTIWENVMATKRSKNNYEESQFKSAINNKKLADMINKYWKVRGIEANAKVVYINDGESFGVRSDLTGEEQP